MSTRKHEAVPLEERAFSIFEDAIGDVADQLKRLNDNLEAGRLNIRTHHPLCTVPPNKDWSVSQLEAASKFLSHAIETGVFVLPPKEGGES